MSQAKTLALRLLEDREVDQVTRGVCLTVDTFSRLAGGLGRDDTDQIGPGCPPDDAPDEDDSINP